MEPTEKSYPIIIPATREQLREFISELLGRKQATNRIVFGPFEVRLGDLLHLHNVINQRIAQNAGQLISFGARIVFKDGSSRLFNTPSDLESFAEIRPLLTESVHLNWSYLIQFPGKSVPEKQDIDVSISSGEGGPSIMDDSWVSGLSLHRNRFIHGGNLMSVAIKHTNRTWGADLDAVISQCLLSFLTVEGETRKFARRHSESVAVVAAGVAFIAPIFWGGLHIYQAQQRVQETVRILAQSATPSIDSISMRVNKVLELVTEASWTRTPTFFIIFTILTGFISVMLATTLASVCTKNPFSWILLTLEDERERTKNLDLQAKKSAKNIFLFALNVIASIIASFIYTKFFT